MISQSKYHKEHLSCEISEFYQASWNQYSKCAKEPK